MRVLVTGGEGQLGSQFPAVVQPPHECVSLGRSALDVTDSTRVHEVFRHVAPDLVVHCAAWTDVDGCEGDPERAYRVNAEGAGVVAEAAAAVSAELIHISTDFVFDGDKPAPYTETDEPNPINAYGLSKLAGEGLVRDACERHYIVRSAWLFGGSRANFVSKVLAIARDQGLLRVADDQVGSPTYVRDLAARVLEMVGRAPHGVYHVTNGEDASRFAWAAEIIRIAGLDVEVAPISASAWVTPARRPANSRLENRALREAGFPPMRGYRDALLEVIPMLLDPNGVPVGVPQEDDRWSLMSET